MTIDTTADGVSEGLPARHIEAFLEHLRTAGYVDSTLRKKQRILTAFVRWMKGDCSSIRSSQTQRSATREFAR